MSGAHALLASAAIANAMVCAFSLWRRGPSLAAGATGLACMACALMLAR
jgi:hypothetical protein